MTLLNLSFVTRSLVNLIDGCVRNSPAWPNGAPLAISPEPPDRLAGVNMLGFYLYHVIEDLNYKNLPPPGNDRAPIRYTPLGLNLYYQLTAHCDAEDDEGSYREQLMMGLAMKALHDFPLVDDSTLVNGQTVFVPGLRAGDNRLRISLVPVQPEQSVEYWTPGDRPLRLSAYYQVTVSLLEPEESSRRAGRVLQFGVYVFPAGAPHLIGSRNALSFTVPGETGARTVELQPAQAPFGGQIAFLGNDLAGDQTTLMLQAADWDQPEEAGADWGVIASDDRLFATVQTTAGNHDVLPGLYTAAARVVTMRPAPGGLTKEFAGASNETPFTILPRIDALTPPTPAGNVTVTGFIFQHPDLPAAALQVYVGENRLEARAAGPLNPGQYTVSGPTSLDLRLPADLPSNTLTPFRLLINRAESAPLWIRVP
jgi:Pvc16 N-terminal domain